MADLTKIIDVVAGIAPALATALGGPLAGGAVEILAKTLGTQPEPDAIVKAAAQKDPAVLKAEIERAEAEFKAAAEQAVTLRAQIDAHVRMVELDYARGAFYSAWRPLAGWVALIYAAATCLLVVKDAWVGSYAFLALAPSVLMIGGPIMALAGIYAWGRTEERKALATGGADRIAEMVKSVIGRK